MPEELLTAPGSEVTLSPHSGWETYSSLTHTDQIVVWGGRGAGTRKVQREAVWEGLEERE